MYSLLRLCIILTLHNIKPFLYINIKVVRKRKPLKKIHNKKQNHRYLEKYSNDNAVMIIKTRISKDEGNVDSTFSLIECTR